MTKQIAINLADNLCPTLMATAFAKARIDYFLGGGKVWHYPAILVVCDK